MNLRVFVLLKWVFPPKRCPYMFELQHGVEAIVTFGQNCFMHKLYVISYLMCAFQLFCTNFPLFFCSYYCVHVLVE